jgi:hypothetical protein
VNSVQIKRLEKSRALKNYPTAYEHCNSRHYDGDVISHKCAVPRYFLSHLRGVGGGGGGGGGRVRRICIINRRFMVMGGAAGAEF